jgi:hypothetical protein
MKKSYKYHHLLGNKRYTLVLKTSTIVNKVCDNIHLDYTRYTYEFYWCGLFAFAIIFFIRGRSANDALATKYNKGISEAISSNFAHFGTQKDPSLALDKITFSDYHYYASGRQNCLYALLKYDLKKRQDFFSTFGMELVWTKKDLVHIEIPIKVPEYQLAEGSVSTSIPLEFMIARKKEIKAIH